MSDIVIPANMEIVFEHFLQRLRGGRTGNHLSRD